MKSFRQVAEEFVPKFERATKTDVHYTGRINNKTYVVPHAFHGNHDVLHGTKTTPIRHSIVVSPTHVQHNNPSLSPEEVARVHSHIKDIHGGQQESWLPMRGPKASKETSEVNAEHAKWEKEHAATRKELKAARPMRTGAADRFLRRYGKTNEERQLALHLGMRKSDSQAPKPAPIVKPKRAPSAINKETDAAAYQAERDKYRHTALAASRKAATIAFAKKHHIINEDTMLNENKYGFAPGFIPKAGRGDVATYHQTQIAKKTLRMPDAMLGVMGGPSKDDSRKHLKKMGWTEKQIHDHEHAQFVQEHSGSEKRLNPDGSYKAGLKVTVDGKPGEISHVHHSPEHPKYPHSYKITDTAANDPYKQTRLRGNTFISHHDVKPLHERTLTTGEDAKKEEIVKSMKKKVQGFKERYGKDAKSVMYATATKQAKKLAENMSPEHVHYVIDRAEHPKDYEQEKRFNANVQKGLHIAGKDKLRDKAINKRFGHNVAKGMAITKAPSFTKRFPLSGVAKKIKTNEEVERLDELSDAAKNFVHHREEHWKHEKLNRHAQDRTAARFHANEMEKHFHAMTPSEKYRAHTGSYVSSPSKRLGGGSAKEDKQYVHESFMGTYTRNENANRHTANIVHLAKHFGNAADQAEAKFYKDELKKHGHNKHHEAAYKLHEKLWPFAAAAHHMKESQQLDELKMPKFGFVARHVLGSTHRGIVKDVHGMAHGELSFLHKSHGDRQDPKGSPAEFQHHAIKRELKKRGDAEGTHKPLDKSKFVKKNLEETHSDTFNTVKRVLSGE